MFKNFFQKIKKNRRPKSGEKPSKKYQKSQKNACNFSIDIYIFPTMC